MMEDPTPPKPPRLQPLEYRGRRYQSDLPTGPGAIIEFVVGFFAYAGMLSAIVFFLSQSQNVASTIPWPVLVIVPVIILAGLAFYLHGWQGWRGFIPGVITGILFSCLFGVAGAFWLCSNFKN